MRLMAIAHLKCYGHGDSGHASRVAVLVARGSSISVDSLDKFKALSYSCGVAVSHKERKLT